MTAAAKTTNDDSSCQNNQSKLTAEGWLRLPLFCSCILSNLEPCARQPLYRVLQFQHTEPVLFPSESYLIEVVECYLARMLIFWKDGHYAWLSSVLAPLQLVLPQPDDKESWTQLISHMTELYNWHIKNRWSKIIKLICHNLRLLPLESKHESSLDNFPFLEWSQIACWPWSFSSLELYYYYWTPYSVVNLVT